MDSKYIKTYRAGEKHDFEYWIAKLYCLLLPFRMVTQFSFLYSIVGVCANYLPFIFHVAGLFLWLYNERGSFSFGEKTSLASSITKLVIWLNCSSIIMAIVIQLLYGNHGSENAFQGIIGMIIYFFQYLLMFLYNYRVFKILSIDEIDKCFRIVCKMLLVIAYGQILVMNGIGANVYDRLNVFGMLNSSRNLPKLCLSGVEGASAGGVIGVFVLPYLYSRILSGDRKRIIEVLLWLMPIYYTYSTTAYILVSVCTVLFILLAVLQSESPQRAFQTLLAIFGIFIIIYLVLRLSNILDKETITKIEYLLMDKATDKENGSTVSRTVPLLVNWGAFTEFPILGVGNGLQGYFYEKYFPEWALRVPGSDVGVFLSRSTQGISNGGLFIPSLLSGYGIVGCLAIIWFVLKCIREIRNCKERIGHFYYAYILAGFVFVVQGFQGDLYGMYYAWFMISIPFMSGMEHTPNNEASIKLI